MDCNELEHNNVRRTISVDLKSVTSKRKVFFLKIEIKTCHQCTLFVILHIFAIRNCYYYFLIMVEPKKHNNMHFCFSILLTFQKSTIFWLLYSCLQKKFSILFYENKFKGAVLSNVFDEKDCIAKGIIMALIMLQIVITKLLVVKKLFKIQHPITTGAFTLTVYKCILHYGTFSK